MFCNSGLHNCLQCVIDYFLTMGKTSDLSPRKLALIKCLLQEKRYTQGEIADRLKISQSSVCRVKKSLDFGYDYASSRAGSCGRKSKFTPRMERKLVQLSKTNRRATSKDLKITMEQYGVNVCDSSIRRRLIAAGLHARRPRKKAKITPVMAKKRLAWAKEMQQQFGNDWSKVNFSFQKLIS